MSSTSNATSYFQYINSRSGVSGEQVFFWLTEAGSTSNWLQLVTNYSQAKEIASWIASARRGASPKPLELTLKDGELKFTSTEDLITISGANNHGKRLTVTFLIAGYGWMLMALIFSIQVMVNADVEIMNDVTKHPLIKEIVGQ